MIVDCAVYHKGVRTKVLSSVADAAVRAKQGPGFVLLASSEPDPEETRQLATAFDLPALAVEDWFEGHQRPKLEDYGGCLFAVVRCVTAEAAAVVNDAPAETGQVLGSRLPQNCRAWSAVDPKDG